ncbi:MAG: hypothetical protein NVSMB16_04030 [Acidimicrobiales bacterium]
MGGAAGVLVLAFVGGAVSGKLEHRPTARVVAAPPQSTTSLVPTTSLGPTTSLTSQQASAVQTVKLSVIEDMSLDVESQRLDPDVHRRLALSESPAAVARRHAEIARAWAPDRVAATVARYDAVVRANASDPNAPSVTDGAFVVTKWGDVTISGMTARAMCRGHFRLIEPTNPASSAGAIEQPDRDWVITLSQSGGRWRLEDRTAD